MESIKYILEYQSLKYYYFSNYISLFNDEYVSCLFSRSWNVLHIEKLIHYLLEDLQKLNV